MSLIKALVKLLNEQSCKHMIQSVDLSNNLGIEDCELNFLTQSLTALNRSYRGDKPHSLRHLNLGKLGASPTAISNLLKALPQLPQLNSLDLSGNTLPFFCVDALLNSLKTI